MLALSLAGCGTPVNMSAWQQSLEHYVRTDGGGDPAVLRNITIQGDHRGFTLIGGDDPRNTTDARGLLLGHKTVGGQPWFIYLVGIVHDQKVREMRLAALAVKGGRFDWVLGPKNSDATQMYRNYNEGLGKRRNPGRRHAPLEYSSFPRSEDQFELSIDGNHVSAIHKGSGAWWQMTLPARAGIGRSNGMPDTLGGCLTLQRYFGFSPSPGLPGEGERTVHSVSHLFLCHNRSGAGRIEIAVLRSHQPPEPCLPKERCT